MLLPDVNILVGAFRTDHAHHQVMDRWLASTLTGHEVLGLTPVVVSGYVRMVTNPRVFDLPTPLDQALGQIADLRTNKTVLDALPGPTGTSPVFPE